MPPQEFVHQQCTNFWQFSITARARELEEGPRAADISRLFNSPHGDVPLSAEGRARYSEPRDCRLAKVDVAAP